MRSPRYGDQPSHDIRRAALDGSENCDQEVRALKPRTQVPRGRTTSARMLGARNGITFPAHTTASKRSEIPWASAPTPRRSGTKVPCDHSLPSVRMYSRTPVRGIGTTRTRRSIRRGNPSRRQGDEAAGTGEQGSSIGSVTGTGHRRALATHTLKGPSPFPTPWPAPPTLKPLKSEPWNPPAHNREEPDRCRPVPPPGSRCCIRMRDDRAHFSGAERVGSSWCLCDAVEGEPELADELVQPHDR